MPRWFEVALTLVLFTAVMLLARWGLNTWVPPAVDWLGGIIGLGGIWAIFLPIMGLCGFVGFWPRTPDGRLRPLLPPRRG